MKILNKIVQMVVWFDENGIPTPVRFRFKNKDESFTIIKINDILIRDKEHLAGNPMLVYRCKSYINGIEKLYEIKYEINSCKWILWKI
ncbi:hypothetical protein [Clostridium rectalis]|uniref:hypothetical protein n=1 Tax=Clostridium rectalis TaxID=2040295 RepID=UPI000F6328EE|nr:hypothetical protein [Clostridium rectalis]